MPMWTFDGIRPTFDAGTSTFDGSVPAITTQVVQSVGVNFYSATSATLTLAPTASGNALVLEIAVRSGSSASTGFTVSDGTNTYITRVFGNNAVDQRSIAIVDALNAASVTSVTVTPLSGGGMSGSIGLQEVAGITAFDAAQLSLYSSSPQTVANLSADKGTTDFVAAAISVGNNSGSQGITDPPAGYTSAAVQQNDSGSGGYGSGECCYRVNSSAVTDSATWGVTGGGAAGDPAVIASYIGGPLAVVQYGVLRRLGPGISPNYETMFRARTPAYSPAPLLAAGAAAIGEASDGIVALGASILRGQIGVTEGPDGIVAFATSRVSGILNAGELADGIVAAIMTANAGSLALTEASDGITASGQTGVSGSVHVTEGPDQCVGITIPASLVALTEGPDGITASGVTTTTGVAALGERPDGIAAGASLSVSGALSAQESPDGIVAVAPYVNIGTAAVSEGPDGIVAGAPQVNVGTASMSETPDGVGGIGFAIPVGTANVKESADGIAASASVSFLGTAAVAERWDGILAAGLTAVAAAASSTESPDGIAASGRTAVSGTGNAQEASDGISTQAINSNPSSAFVGEGRDGIVALATTTPTLFGWADLIAVSQTGVQGERSAYLENSASVVTAAYFSFAGVPFTPNTVSYRIDDVKSGVNLVPWTVIAQPAEINTVIVTAVENTMVSLTRWWEVHEVLFRIVDGYNEINLCAARYDLLRIPGEVQPGFLIGAGVAGEASDGIVATAFTRAAEWSLDGTQPPFDTAASTFDGKL